MYFYFQSRAEKETRISPYILEVILYNMETLQLVDKPI